MLNIQRKAYFRIRRYMMEGKDPVALTIRTARECGIAPFLSYRMNEHHYTNNAEAATHSKFWKEHQHLMLESERFESQLFGAGGAGVLFQSDCRIARPPMRSRDSSATSCGFQSTFRTTASRKAWKS